jgi:drug/metabolite transporter (DMT)-like permease
MEYPQVFFAIALISAFSYALQGVLMATYYRSMDTLSAVAYRGLSLIFSMAILLVFVPGHMFERIPQALPAILAASLCATLGNWAQANSFKSLPLGIATALGISFAVMVASAIGFFFFGEMLSAWQTLLMVLLLTGIVLLGFSRSTGPLPKDHNVPKGVSFALLFGLFLGAGYALIGSAARQLHPFLAGYMWETIIGLMAAGLAFSRKWFNGPSLAKVSLPLFWKILVASAPTAIGTGFYALAMTLGPIALATALISTTIVFTTLLSRLIYRERLTIWQWSLLLAICLIVGTLRYMIN